MKKILMILLLGLGLSYTAYAEDGNNLSDSEIDARNTGYILQQFEFIEAWEDAIPEASLRQEDVLSYQGSPRTNEHDGNQLYLTFVTNHTFYAQDPEFMVIVDDYSDVGGKIPFNTKLLQNIEFGVGQRGWLGDDVRLAFNLKWDRVHMGQPDIHTGDGRMMMYAHMPKDMAMGPATEMGMTPHYGDIMNNVGPSVGIFLDRNKAANSSYNEIFYIGTSLALLRSSLPGFDGDWTVANQVHFGGIATLTNTIDIDLGVTGTWNHGSHNGMFKPYARAEFKIAVLHWMGRGNR